MSPHHHPSSFLAQAIGKPGHFAVSVKVHNSQRSYLLLLTPTLVEKFSKVLPTVTYCDFGGKRATGEEIRRHILNREIRRIRERGFSPFGSWFVHFAVQSPSFRFASG
jgi:hypothetical protein